MRGVEQLRKAALAIEEEFGEDLQKTAPSLRESAYNLVHYLAVRRYDIREFQGALSRLGLSSLGRLEAHVMASLNAVLEVLHVLRERPVRMVAHQNKKTAMLRRLAISTQSRARRGTESPAATEGGA